MRSGTICCNMRRNDGVIGLYSGDSAGYYDRPHTDTGSYRWSRYEEIDLIAEVIDDVAHRRHFHMIPSVIVSA